MGIGAIPLGGSPPEAGVAAAAGRFPKGAGLGGGGAAIDGAAASGLGAGRGAETAAWVAGDIGAGGIGADDAARRSCPACARGGANSSRTVVDGVIVISPPHTAQRARSAAAGSLLGSTRKTERHSGQETFTSPPAVKRGAGG